MAPKKRDDYVYTQLKEIKSEGVVYHTFGVVTEIVKQNGRTAKDYHSIYLITDESLGADDSFRIHMFHQLSNAIDRIDVGWVLRLHRVKAEVWDNNVDGRIFRATDVVVFPPQKIGTLEFYTDAQTIHFTGTVSKRVNELREMSKTMTTEGQGEVSNTSSLKGKRQASPSKVDQPSSKNQRIELNLDECNGTNSVITNPKCGKNRIVNPSAFKPLKNLVPNPLHEAFKNSESTIVKKPFGKQTNDDTSSTCSSSEGYVANEKTTHGTQAKEPCNSIQDTADKPSQQMSTETVAPEELSSPASPCKETRRSIRKAKESTVEINANVKSKNAHMKSSKETPRNCNSGNKNNNKKAEEESLSLKCSEDNAQTSDKSIPAVHTPCRQSLRIAKTANTVSPTSSKRNGNFTRKCVVFPSQPCEWVRKEMNVTQCRRTKGKGVEACVQVVPLLRKRAEKSNCEESPCRSRKGVGACVQDVPLLRKKAEKSNCEENPCRSRKGKGVEACVQDVPLLRKKAEKSNCEENPCRSRKGKGVEACVQDVPLLRKKAEKSNCEENPCRSRKGKGIGACVQDVPLLRKRAEKSNCEENPCRSRKGKGVEACVQDVPLLRKRAGKINDEENQNTPPTTDTSILVGEEVSSDGSADVDGGSSALRECPQFACGSKECQPFPVLLSVDDPRLDGFQKKYLKTESIGVIPAPDKTGRNETFMFNADKQEEMNSFQWMHHCVNVKIIRIKPSLKVLQGSDSKNLISGRCPSCHIYIFYSQLKWGADQTLLVKRPMCPKCYKNGDYNYVSLEFRMKLTGRDAFGKDFTFYVIKEEAAKFLGCTLRDYQENEQCQEKVTKFLSEVIKMESFYNISLFTIKTASKDEFRICGSILSAMSA